MNEIHKKLYDEMLDAELNRDYYEEVASRLSDWDLRIKIFLALTSSSTLAGWTIWRDAETYPHLTAAWKICSGLAMATSVVTPFLNLGKKTEWATALKIAFASSTNDYELLWLRRDLLSEVKLLAETRTIMDREAILATTLSHFPKLNRRLLSLCQERIIRRRALK